MSSNEQANSSNSGREAKLVLAEADNDASSIDTTHLLCQIKRMIDYPLILNEREAGFTRAHLARLDEAISNSSITDPNRYMLAGEVRELHIRALSESKLVLEHMLSSYNRMKEGDYPEIAERWKGEPGIMLIVARIVRGLSQADLAEKLGLKEQQIQRYEAERYRTINLETWRKVSLALGVSVETRISNSHDNLLASLRLPPKFNLSSEQVNKITSHVRTYKWFQTETSSIANKAAIEKYISNSLEAAASPGLLRTGMKSIDFSSDAMLAVWRAHVLQLAETKKNELKEKFDQTDIGWLSELVQQSVHADGPRKAIDLLNSKGIVAIVEPQIQGLKLDGGAFLLGRTPVVGLTLRHDRIDNFWYTLLHEIAHVFLHYNSGLEVGFLDDQTNTDELDELEREADTFASSALVHPERWRQSSVRIAKSASQVESFAKQLKIHPAIVFGKIRRERNDYRIFSDFVGSGNVRNQFLDRRSD
jgi:HTH-type transcriptional regulator / antitoxin HigA